MNRKGIENFGVGSFIFMAVAVIVALTLLTGGISSNVGAVTNKVNVINVTYTAPASAGSSINLVGQAYSNIIVTNATSATVIPASNYTITNYVVSNGQLVTTLTANAGNSLGWWGKGINVSATVEPFGYDTNAGGRAITNMIVIFASLAVAVVVLVPILKNKGLIDFD